MKRISIILILLLVFCIFTDDNKGSASAEKLNIGITSSEASVYGEKISLMSKSRYLQLIERKDLRPLFQELELKQSGAVLGASDTRLKGIDYLVMVDKDEYKYNCRIVKADTGVIIAAFTGFIEEIAGKCIDRLETDVSLKAIESLKNEEGLRVTIELRSSSYKVGEKVEFNVISGDEDVYLYLLDRQPDGTVVVLLPTSNQKEYKIEAGEPVLIPGNLGFSIRATEPAGRDKVIAIVTRRPINIFKFGLTTGNYYSEARGGAKESLSRGMAVELTKLPAKDWGIISEEIEIRK